MLQECLEKANPRRILSTEEKKRLAKHLTNMLAGTIAVITTVSVTNIKIDPEWVLWVLPTALITPVIFWWNEKVRNAN